MSHQSLETAIEQLEHAFDTLSASNKVTIVDEYQRPSALLVTFQPTHNPNCRTRIEGDQDALAQALLVVLADPALMELTNALFEGLLELHNCTAHLNAE